MRLAGGKEKFEERADAFGPGGFVVFGAFDALVMEIPADSPAFVEERVAEAFHVVHDTRALAGADIQPDAG